MFMRVGVLLLIAVATLFAAVNVQIGWLYALGALFVGLLAGSLALGAWRLRRVAATARAEPETACPEPLSVGIELHNHGVMGRSFLAVMAPPLGEVWPVRSLVRQRPPEHWAMAFVEHLAPGEPHVVRLAIPAPRRGAFTDPEVFLLCSPLGLFSWWKRVRIPGEIIVTPRVVPLAGIAGFAPAGGGGDDHPMARTVPEGEMLRSTRSYRPGDPLRMVHWRTSARAGHLVVKETEGTAQAGGATVLLDLDGHTAEGLEHAIHVAASLVSYLAEEGFRVRLISQAGVVEGSVQAQLEALARAGASRERLAPLVADLEPGGLIVVSARDAGWRSMANCWIQVAEPGGRPMEGSVFCPAGCDVAAALGEGLRS